jgi:hypothetical protein
MIWENPLILSFKMCLGSYQHPVENKFVTCAQMVLTIIFLSHSWPLSPHYMFWLTYTPYNIWMMNQDMWFLSFIKLVLYIWQRLSQEN